MSQKIKKRLKTTNFIIYVLLIILLSSCTSDNKSADLALVDGAPIKNEEFSKELKFYQNFYMKKYGENYFKNDRDKGSKKLENLKKELLDTLIKDKIMINDLKANKVDIDDNYANSIKNEMAESLGSEDSLRANVDALNISESEFNDIIFNNSIRRMHFDYFKSKTPIKDSKVLDFYNENESLQRMYKYNLLIFDKKEMADKVRSDIGSSVDFRSYLDMPVKSFEIINSDFVYDDDKFLKKAQILEKDKVSKVFKMSDKYYILMINSYNENQNELLINAKNIYLEKLYEKYLNNLIKKSKIKVFI